MWSADRSTSGGWQESPARNAKSLSSSRKNLTLGGLKSPDPWFYSENSTSSNPRRRSSSSSSSSRRNPFALAVRKLVSCFSSHALRSAEDPFSVESKSPSALPSASTSYSYGSFQGNEKKGAGLYSRAHNESGEKIFTKEEIVRATKNFSPALKIGQGGFGTVYKGRLDTGTIVAVKRAKKTAYDGYLSIEFHSEIQMLAQVEHLNLVRYFGYLEYEDERIIVVEYVPNGNVREHLDCFNGKFLDLSARLDIAVDVAHAITYLHTYTDHPIIHRDIKSSNILLTENKRAKVADFGFARLGAESGVTHVSTQVKGTAGYLDPEYLKTYQLTEKSDVYSFGVLLVELVTGRRPIEQKRASSERMTPKWAMKKFAEGNALQTLDPNISPDPAIILAVEKILELAEQCLAPTKHGRPYMRKCAEILWGIRKDYRELLPSSDLLNLPSHRKTPSNNSFFSSFSIPEET